MGRTVREAKIESRSSRLRLPPRSEPYWRVIHEGAHLGYYRGTRSGKWVARFRNAGADTKGYSKVTLGEADDVADADGDRFLNFRQAQDRARDWFEQAASGVHKRSQFTVADALDEYMETFRGKSIVATRSRIEAILKPELGHLRVAELTSKIIADWHHSRASSPARLRTSKRAGKPNIRPIAGPEDVRHRRSTANRDLTVLKAALNRAALHRNGLPVDAWRNVKPYPKVDGAKLRYLSDDEARRLVNATNGKFRPLVQAALLTGARYGELRAVRVSDFDGPAGVLRLSETKSGTPRVVYLEQEGVRLFERACAGKRGGELAFQRPAGGKWGASQQARPLEEASSRAQIERATFHDLRRTYGARLALKGVPMAVIADALGHADERITRRHYAHLSPSYVANTVRATVAGLGIVDCDNVVPLAREFHNG
jgi:integrase